MKASKPLANSLRFLSTMLLLFLVFKSVDLHKIGHDLNALNLESLILLLIICWMGQFICAERWRIFAVSLQMYGSYRSFVQMYFVGMFFNIGLPSLVGGDVVKAFIVSRKSGRPMQIGLASVLQDRAAGLISLLVYGSLAIIINPVSWKGFSLQTVYLFCWAAVAIALWLVGRGGELLGSRILPRNRASLQGMLNALSEFHKALGLSRLKRGAVLRIILYSFVNSCLILLVFQQVTVAAGHPVDIIVFFALFPLITLATMLPVTLGGLGVREWFYVEALSLIGIPREQALIVSLATSALLLLCNFAGIIFLPSIPREIRRRGNSYPENAHNQNAAGHRIS
jgi:uncharacterized protein (TIRG00374 family)